MGGPESGYAAMESAFARAAARAGRVERSFVAGGIGIRFAFAGPALSGPLSAALAEGAGARPLEVCAWDTVSTGVEAPPLPGLDDAVRSPDETRFHLGPRFSFAITPASGLAIGFDALRSRAVVRASAPDALPPWEVAAPLRAPLAWHAAAEGSVLAHGAAVGDERGGVLLVGPGGSGKSTAALACLRAGMRFLGDDFVLVRRDLVFGLYATAKLRPEDLAARFPGLAPLARPLPGAFDKAVLFLGRDGRFPDPLPVRAIVAPRVAGGAVRLERASKGAILRALAPSSVLPVPGAGPPAFARLAALAASVPAFSLDAGPDLDALAEAVSRALDVARTEAA